MEAAARARKRGNSLAKWCATLFLAIILHGAVLVTLASWRPPNEEIVTEQAPITLELEPETRNNRTRVPAVDQQPDGREPAAHHSTNSMSPAVGGDSDVAEKLENLAKPSGVKPTSGLAAFSTAAGGSSGPQIQASSIDPRWRVHGAENGLSGGHLRGTPPCNLSNLYHLTSAEKDRCNELYASVARNAPEVDDIPAEKRSYYDEVAKIHSEIANYRAGDKMPGHGPSFQCRYGKCGFVAPQGFLTEELGVKRP